MTTKLCCRFVRERNLQFRAYGFNDRSMLIPCHNEQTDPWELVLVYENVMLRYVMGPSSRSFESDM
jgi:hypothetical protein